MAKNMFLISTDSDSGNSVVTLGIIEMLFRNVEKVAYFRPFIHVGAGKTISDHFELLKKHFGLGIDFKDMYAYTYEEAETMIARGHYDELVRDVIQKYKKLEDEYDFVLIEGSDFESTVASFEIDVNAKIAKALSAPVLLLIPGKNREIYNILQSLKYMISSFSERGCDIFGTIITRVNEDRSNSYLNIITDEVDLNNQFVAVLPESKIINTPTVGEIVKYLNGTVLFGEEQLHKQVSYFSIGSMHLGNYLWGLSNSAMVVATGDRIDLILGSMLAHQSNNFPDIAGIVLTGDYVIDNMVLNLIEGLPNKIPVIVVRDTLNETMKKLEGLRARILPDDRFKIATAFNIFDAYINTDMLAKKIVETKTTKVTPRMFEYNLIKKAQSKKMHIVLPEGVDERILYATETLALRNIADITLLGNEEKIRHKIQELGLKINAVNIVDPETSKLLEVYSKKYYDMRKSKGITMEAAVKVMQDVNYFGTMMVQQGDADGMVSGAVHSTADTIRPAFQIIKTKPGCPIVSSVFLMCLEDRVLVYGDCAVNPNPTAEELAYIASTSAETALLFDIEPKIALLSYSSGASGKGEDVERVKTATARAKEMHPDLKIEGPLQYDAAVSKEVARTKMPDSEIAGEINVFIFPDLNTGNNTYKAVQRETGAIAIGPILQGLNKPVNDLSRGCSIDDIVNTVIITAIQAQMMG